MASSLSTTYPLFSNPPLKNQLAKQLIIHIIWQVVTSGSGRHLAKRAVRAVEFWMAAYLDGVLPHNRVKPTQEFLNVGQAIGNDEPCYLIVR